VVGTLAAHLKGRSGRTLDHLKALHNYHLNHQEEVSLSPELASQPYEQYITQLEKYGSDALNAKKETEKRRLERVYHFAIFSTSEIIENSSLKAATCFMAF